MRLFTEVRGDGPETLLLVHGLGASRDHFHATADALAGRARVLLPDLRGHGDSPRAPITGIGDHVDDVVALVDEHGPLHLAGASFGATLAAPVWRARPGALRSVTLIDPVLDDGPVERYAAAAGDDRRSRIRAAIEPYLRDDEDELVELMARFPLTADLDEDARRRNARSHLRADRDLVIDTLRVMRDAGPWRRPRGARGRALVVRGALSPSCPRGAAWRLALRLRGRAVAVPGGHCVPLAAPVELAEALARVVR